eukprot:GDKI01023839.1.p2 GENE.GDKI01023839.1~~GDKI01023839.1.p2  ORF type:complete len:172 (+),score=47.58 GDKI01023839.1:35-550(+)
MTDSCKAPVCKQMTDVSPAQLCELAVQATKHCYCPYSKFPCGAALLTEMGVFLGANVENAAYPSGLCAERTAIVKAISEGARQFKALAVVCYNLDGYASPCGGCRQMMVEFGDYPVYLVKLGQSGEAKGQITYNTTSSLALLPGAFCPDSMNADKWADRPAPNPTADRHAH